MSVPSLRAEMAYALREAQNALLDYVPQIERTGASLNYGRHVLQLIGDALDRYNAEFPKEGHSEK